MPVLYSQQGAVGVLTLSRPAARNCWGSDFSEGLAAELVRLEADGTVRAVVITGDEAGRAFSAGADLKDPNTHTLETMADFFAELPRWRSFVVRHIDSFPKPLIAAVNGYAIGIGCILTYCCDLIVASERAEWRQPQVSLGIIPAFGGSVRLARWVGKGQAMKLSMGFPLDAAEAYRIGLAQWLVPHAELMAKANEVAGHIAAMPPLATRLAKESLNRGLDIPNIDDASWVDVYRFLALGLTDEAKARHEAWRQRS
ncbi:MAG: enoyl-CoA hydratase/isomerase family protein [Hyphomicrobiaceae bacterium]|nr:enoyl-CoA hydratase/isomerase family protein [Hyphomicrobiaceae bacterium]